MKKRYQESSQTTKRATVGISSAGITILVIYLIRDVLEAPISYEVAGVIGSMLAGLTGWTFSGGPYDLVLGFFRFLNRVRDVRDEE